ncbi:MAG: hypothetical protein KDK39_14410, partial [Leptospiraceae bacterium]|nr:hypothetical protein [Leptospiraceae bacterium]
LNDTMQFHWGSYSIAFADKLIYFAGDTGYSTHFERIAKRSGRSYDAVLMPIGAYKPRWFMEGAHIGPVEALQASRTLQATVMLPIHWGTLALGDDLPSESALFLQQLQQKQAPSDSLSIRIWRIGESLDL